MGLNEGTNKTFIRISDGQIALSVNSDFPGATKVVNSDTGKVTWVKYYRSIDGYLTKLENKQNHFDKKSYNWVLTIEDEDKTYELSIKERSGYGRSLMNSLPNVDFTKRITFSPYLKVDGSNKKATLYLSQDNKNVEWFFTRENPNGLPELVAHTDARGNTTYDDSAIKDFYLKYVQDVIVPRIEKAAVSSDLAAIEHASEQISEQYKEEVMSDKQSVCQSARGSAMSDMPFVDDGYDNQPF